MWYYMIIYDYICNNVGKTIINNKNDWESLTYHLFMIIYGDLGDGLLSFYPHYSKWNLQHTSHIWFSSILVDSQILYHW